jgi:hypothetical protein
MQTCGLFNGLCVATVAVAAVMSMEFGDWFIWVPVVAALVTVAGLRKTMSRGPRKNAC